MSASLRPPATDEFYVGYQKRAPVNQARHTYFVIAVHVVLSMIAATLIVGSMRDPGPGVWEDATPETFSGVYVKSPYPMLLLDEGASKEAGASRMVLLVDFGKRGAQRRLSAVEDGQRISVSGYPLHRDSRFMLELAPDEGAVKPAEDAITPRRAMDRGERRTLRGEIVDSKCFLGAMKPGDGKTHKACAVRCISGGIPPLLACWDGEGGTSYYLLADEQGGAVGEWLLPLVGEAVEVTGALEQAEDMMILRIAPSGVRRL